MNCSISEKHFLLLKNGETHNFSDIFIQTYLHKAHINHHREVVANSTRMPGGIKLTDLHTMFADAQAAGADAVTPFCLNCRSDGHLESQCTELRRCYICLQSSHVAYQCLENPVPGSIAYNSDVRCVICGEKGHIDSYCRSRDGPLFNKPLSRAIAETTYPKPLVLRTAEGNGPKEEILQAARADVAGVLRRWRPSVLASKMRDVELFQTALPALRDPSVSSSDLTILRRALAVLRSAVVGSLTLDGSSPPHRRHGGVTNEGSGSHDGQLSGDVLHDMRVSGLNLNVVVGDRVETFRRAPASARSAGRTKAVAGVVTSKIMLEEMAGKACLPPPSASPPLRVSVTEPSRVGDKRINSTVVAASAPVATTPNTSESPKNSARLSQLRHSLDEAQRISRQPYRGNRTEICSVHSNGPAVPPKARSGESSNAAKQDPSNGYPSSSAFTSSLPEFMEHKSIVAKKILKSWETSGPDGSGAKSLTLAHPPKSRHPSWIDDVQAPGIAREGGGGINSWPRYYLSQPATTSEVASKGSLAVTWRKRFEVSKASKNNEIRLYLARREAHRNKVYSCEDKFGEIMRHAEEEAAGLTPSLPSSSSRSSRPASARHYRSFWTSTCRDIAAHEAESVLVKRFRDALSDYVSRQKGRGEGGTEFDSILEAVKSYFDTDPDGVLMEESFEELIKNCIPAGGPQTALGGQLVAFIVQLCRDVQTTDETRR